VAVAAEQPTQQAVEQPIKMDPIVATMAAVRALLVRWRRAVPTGRRGRRPRAQQTQRNTGGHNS